MPSSSRLTRRKPSGRVRPPSDAAAISTNRRRVKELEEAARKAEVARVEAEKAANVEAEVQELLMQRVNRPPHPASREPLHVVLHDILPAPKTDTLRAHERRRERANQRNLFAFQKINPANAEMPAGDINSEGLLRCVVYAESNEEAKYASVLVGDGFCGRLCVVAGKIVWNPIRPKGYKGLLPDRLDLDLSEHTELDRRNFHDRIVFRVRLATEYTSDGEKSLDYRSYCFILWNGRNSEAAINMISWFHKQKIDASSDSAAKKLAYAHWTLASNLQIHQCRRVQDLEYATDEDSAHSAMSEPEWVKQSDAESMAGTSTNSADNGDSYKTKKRKRWFFTYEPSASDDKFEIKKQAAEPPRPKIILNERVAKYWDTRLTDAAYKQRWQRL